MQQVLVNLLVNAGDAMGETGGTITVTTDLSEGAVRIRVNDTGCGIETKDLDKIFEPFFTTKGTRGNGLGLAIVWGIVEGHGGRLTVESDVGKGTTFTILMPLAQPMAEASRPRPLP
jgi:two-component system NtrC family sensor kinase